MSTEWRLVAYTFVLCLLVSFLMAYRVIRLLNQAVRKEQGPKED
jgi:hypothetical protein